MSKQKGLIMLEGNIGGISFYSANGEFLARRANGPSKDRIASDPAFKRTRENNMEFGGCAKIAKAFRLSLSGAAHTMGGTRLVSRLTKLFKAVNLKSEGTRGQRRIELSKNKQMLFNFNFDAKQGFSSVFNAPLVTNPAENRRASSLQVAAFIPGNFIKSPAGATHFRLINALGVVSDYAFNPEVRAYEPAQPAFNSIGGIAYSDLTDLNAASVSFDVPVTLSGEGELDSQVSVVQCAGVEFFQVIGSNQYLLAQGHAMKVVNVF